MFETYVVIAWRRLVREKMYVVMNVASLALGIAGALLIGLYLRSELTYDQHHRNHERIYRLTTQIANADGESQSWAAAGPGLGPMITQQFPQLGTYVRFQPAWDITMRVGDNERLWSTVYFVDPAVFDMFTHASVYGDSKDALNAPLSVAVSQSFARFYFGDTNPVGRTVVGENGMSFKIAYVFKDLPENTHLRYDFLASIQLLDQIMPGYTANYAKTLWQPYVQTYLKTPEQFDANAFDALTRAFVGTHAPDQTSTKRVKIVPQRLDRIHFGPELRMDLPTGNVLYVFGVAAFAAVLLVVAVINYVNLATARAVSRAKEVGLRKVFGASRLQLVTQFLAEAATFTAIALVLAIGCVWVLLEVTTLGALMGKDRLIDHLAEPEVLLAILGGGTLVAFASGLYPAVYLASVSMMAAFKPLTRSWCSGQSLRNALVLVQLVISIGVVTATLTMLAQMRYIDRKPLGFDTENRLVVTVRGYEVVKQTAAIRSALRAEPTVSDVTTISTVPGTGSWSDVAAIESNSATMESVVVDHAWVGANFVEAMNLQLIEGRGFNEVLQRDVHEAVLVNESLVRRMGWQKAIGKRVEVEEYLGKRTAYVVGVTRDAHYASLRKTVGPMMLSPMDDIPPPPPPGDEGVYTRSFVVAFSEPPSAAILDGIEKTIRAFDPRFNLDASFLRDLISDQYRFESDAMRLMASFGTVCIVLSGIGIFGLAAFATAHRTKEIGVRKVLGASDAQIVRMLGRPLAWLVLAAAIPAFGASYFAMSRWLERFAYRVELRPGQFLIAAAFVGVIALTTLVLQCMRTMRSNPIEALRYE